MFPTVNDLRSHQFFCKARTSNYPHCYHSVQNLLSSWFFSCLKTCVSPLFFKKGDNWMKIKVAVSPFSQNTDDGVPAFRDTCCFRRYHLYIDHVLWKVANRHFQLHLTLSDAVYSAEIICFVRLMGIANSNFNVPTDYRNYVISPTVSHNEMLLWRTALKAEYLICTFESAYGVLLCSWIYYKLNNSKNTCLVWSVNK